jgi:hypothetical protein
MAQKPEAQPNKPILNWKDSSGLRLKSTLITHWNEDPVMSTKMMKDMMKKKVPHKLTWPKGSSGGTEISIRTKVTEKS